MVSSKEFLVSTRISSGGYSQPLNRRAADTAQAEEEESSGCQETRLYTYRRFYPRFLSPLQEIAGCYYHSPIYMEAEAQSEIFWSV